MSQERTTLLQCGLSEDGRSQSPSSALIERRRNDLATRTILTYTVEGAVTGFLVGVAVGVFYSVRTFGVLDSLGIIELFFGVLIGLIGLILGP